MNWYKVAFTYIFKGTNHLDLEVIRSDTPQDAADEMRKRLENYVHKIERIAVMEKNRWTVCTLWK